jgi:hypothetical protein
VFLFSRLAIEQVLEFAGTSPLPNVLAREDRVILFGLSKAVRANEIVNHEDRPKHRAALLDLRLAAPNRPVSRHAQQGKSDSHVDFPLAAFDRFLLDQTPAYARPNSLLKRVSPILSDFEPNPLSIVAGHVLLHNRF